MPVLDPGISTATGLPPSLSDAIDFPPDPDHLGVIPHGPVTSPDHVAALCADLRPGISLLTKAYPEFTISEPEPGRNGLTWTVIRKRPGQPGLYAAVTSDLGELRDILARHTTQQPNGNESET
jgi:hypothetical protein